MDVGGNGDVHHLRIGQLRLSISCDIFVDRLTWRRGLKRLLLADGADRVAFVIVRGEDQRLLRQAQQALKIARIGRGGRRSGNRCGRCRG